MRSCFARLHINCNVGIQQGGVVNAVPNVISKSEFDKLTLFMGEDAEKYSFRKL